jgi:uncharacterized protein (DUF305 family)
MKRRSIVAASTLFLSIALLAGACSSDDHDMGNGSAPMDMSEGSPTISVPDDAEFNATDVAFAQGMIPHHAQAIEMSEMALETSSNPDVVRLATQIKAAQDPEIQQLTQWLEGWDQPVPEATGAHDMDGMGSMMMSGMMSQEDMERLASAAGPSFDRMWMEMMILHHEGAVEMAEEQVANGEYRPAVTVAEQIIASQQTEIDEMNGLLAAL